MADAPTTPAAKPAAAPAAKPQPYQVVTTDRQLSTVRYSPCGKFLVAAGRDGTIRRWQLPDDAKPAEPAAAEAPAAAPATAGDAKPKKDDVKKAAAKPPAKPAPPELVALPSLVGHNGWVTSLALQADGKRLFSADSWGALRCWPYAEQQPQPLWKLDAAHDGWVRQIALSPDGRTLASCGLDKAIRLWSAADGKMLQELARHEEDLYSVAFHPDGRSLVAGDLKGVVKQWDLASGKATREFDCRVLHRLERLQDVGGVRVLAFDLAGKTLAAAGTKPETGGFVQGVPAMLLFDWESGKPLASPTLGAKTDVYVHDMFAHRDGYFVGVTSGQPGNGQLFFQTPGEEQPFFMLKLANCHSVALHPEGRRLAVASNAGIYGQALSKAKQGEYPGNSSPIHIFEMPSGVA